MKRGGGLTIQCWTTAGDHTNGEIVGTDCGGACWFLYYQYSFVYIPFRSYSPSHSLHQSKSSRERWIGWRES